MGSPESRNNPVNLAGVGGLGQNKCQLFKWLRPACSQSSRTRRKHWEIARQHDDSRIPHHESLLPIYIFHPRRHGGGAPHHGEFTYQVQA